MQKKLNSNSTILEEKKIYSCSTKLSDSDEKKKHEQQQQTSSVRFLTIVLLNATSTKSRKLQNDDPYQM